MKKILIIVCMLGLLSGCVKENQTEIPNFDPPAQNQNLNQNQNKDQGSNDEQKDNTQGKENQGNDDLDNDDDGENKEVKENKEDKKEKDKKIEESEKKDPKEYEKANIYITVIYDSLNKIINENWNKVADEITNNETRDYTKQIQDLKNITELLKNVDYYIDNEKGYKVSGEDEKTIEEYKECMKDVISSLKKAVNKTISMCETKELKFETLDEDLKNIKDNFVKANENISIEE